MRKVSFTNLGVLAAVLAMRPYGNGIEFDLDDSAVVIVDGDEVKGGAVAGATASSAPASAGAGTDARAPVGPYDQFAGPWRPGDRLPTEMEQITKPNWFLDLPNTNIDDPNGPAPVYFSNTISFFPGIVVDLPWPQLGQQKTRVVMNGQTGKLAVRITVPRDSAVGKRSKMGFVRTAGINDRDFVAASGLLSVPHVINRGDMKNPEFTFTVDKGSETPGMDTDLSGAQVVYASFDVKTPNDWELDFAVPR